jgi:uncharacterized membrane protein
MFIVTAMGTAQHRYGLDDAFSRVEETILPEIAAMLDALLDKAALDKPDMDKKTYAAKLQAISLEVEALTRQIEALSNTQAPDQDYRTSSAA